MPKKSIIRRLARGSFALVGLGLLLSAGWFWARATSHPAKPRDSRVIHARLSKPIGGMVKIPAGRLPLGSHFATCPADRPLPTVRVETFWMDATEVTNRQFAEFVSATGYVTRAERKGASDAFHARERKWKRTAGADWRHPQGEDSSIAGRENYPVVQVSWQDAAAYARWAGKRLPTEYEWEYAARGGLYDADYPWGRQETPDGDFQANTWQGWFPDEDRATDGHADLAPVGSYLPNRYGLLDMSGNVWEWCADRYSAPQPQAHPRLATLKRDLARELESERTSDLTGVEQAASGESSEERRIRRGGSWLCCENYSLGDRLSTRDSVPASASSNHLGFRCVSDQPTILPLDTATLPPDEPSTPSPSGKSSQATSPQATSPQATAARENQPADIAR